MIWRDDGRIKFREIYVQVDCEGNRKKKISNSSVIDDFLHNPVRKERKSKKIQKIEKSLSTIII